MQHHRCEYNDILGGVSFDFYTMDERNKNATTTDNLLRDSIREVGTITKNSSFVDRTSVILLPLLPPATTTTTTTTITTTELLSDRTSRFSRTWDINVKQFVRYSTEAEDNDDEETVYASIEPLLRFAKLWRKHANNVRKATVNRGKRKSLKNFLHRENAYIRDIAYEEILYNNQRRKIHPRIIHLAEIDRFVNLCKNDKILSYADLSYESDAVLRYVNWRKRWTSRGFVVAESTALKKKRESVSITKSSFYRDIPILQTNIQRIVENSSNDKIRWPKVNVVFVLSESKKVNVLLLRCRLLFARQNCLQKDGSILLLISSFFLSTGANNVILDLAQHFRSISVIKPPHSAITNDERYVLFSGYDPIIPNESSSSKIANCRTIRTLQIFLLTEIEISIRQYHIFRRFLHYLTSKEDARGIRQQRRLSSIADRKILQYIHDDLELPQSYTINNRI